MRRAVWALVVAFVALGGDYAVGEPANEWSVVEQIKAAAVAYDAQDCSTVLKLAEPLIDPPGQSALPADLLTVAYEIVVSCERKDEAYEVAYAHALKATAIDSISDDMWRFRLAYELDEKRDSGAVETLEGMSNGRGAAMNAIPIRWMGQLYRRIDKPESVALKRRFLEVVLTTEYTPNEPFASTDGFAIDYARMLHGDGNTRQCMATAVAAYKEAFGFDAPPYAYADLEESDVIVLIGSNIAIAHPILWHRVMCNPHQPQIVVIDPRATETSMAATQHLAPYPKSDQTLLYGVARLLMENGWIDQQFIADHTSGFDAFGGGFVVQNPPRVAIDLPGVGNAMGRSSVEVNQGNVRSVNVAQAGDRTRLVLNLKQASNFRTQLQGKVLLFGRHTGIADQHRRSRACLIPAFRLRRCLLLVAVVFDSMGHLCLVVQSLPFPKETEVSR